MITYESVKAALDSIVEEYGHDYKRNVECRYLNDDDTPRCIVGVYLTNYCNVPAQFFWDNDTGAGARNSKGIYALAKELDESFGLKWDTMALGLLSSAQREQDAGESWGKAVEIAAKQRISD